MEELRSKTCCLTGHRTLPPDEAAQIADRLDAALRQLIDQGYRYFGIGGARGFDTLAAQCILRLQAFYPAIRLILVLPCRDQARGWPLRDKFIYLWIKRQADKLVYTAQCYEPGCMQKRNRHLVAHSSCCLCYLTSRTGGTAYTVACAKRAGLTVLNIADPPDTTSR